MTTTDYLSRMTRVRQDGDRVIVEFTHEALDGSPDPEGWAPAEAGPGSRLSIFRTREQADGYLELVRESGGDPHTEPVHAYLESVRAGE